jgi:glucokinase
MSAHAQDASVPSSALRPDGVTPVIEIGGTHVTAALVDTAAGLVRQGTVRHSPLDASASAEEVLGTILQCARALGDRPAAQ